VPGRAHVIFARKAIGCRRLIGEVAFEFSQQNPSVPMTAVRPIRNAR
jgi:hypothetical protein